MQSLVAIPPLCYVRTLSFSVSREECVEVVAEPGLVRDFCLYIVVLCMSERHLSIIFLFLFKIPLLIENIYAVVPSTLVSL